MKLVPYAPARSLSSITRTAPGLLARLPTTLRRYLGVVFTFSVGFALFFGPAPAYLAALDYSGAGIFMFFIVSNLASAIVFVPLGRLTTRVDPRTLQAGALSIRVAIFPAIGLLALLALVLESIGLGLAFGIIGITWAVVAVTAAGIVTRNVPPSIRGEALGMYTAVSGIGGGIGGLLGGALARFVGYRVTFLIAGLTVLAALVMLLGWASDDGRNGRPSPGGSTGKTTTRLGQ